MSLYRTWRPKTFADLVGQDAVVRTLTSAVEGGKLAHAYLFSGPRGSGKTSAAKILARCINCAAGPTPVPDNSCENCKAMLAGTALDVLEIDAASNRGIEDIRALREAVKFAPSTMRMKVYIIDEAHMLTKEGANAFLKTLEEPPPHAVFILATTEPEKLPVTILSRCQRYAFARIAIPVMIDRMREIALVERIAVDDGALSAIAYRADGGLRDALTMLEQTASFVAAGETIAAETIDLAFGATGRNVARALTDHTIARDAAAVLRSIDEAGDAGADMQVLIRSLIGEFRDLLVARVDPGLLSRDLAPEDARRAAERAAGIAQAQIVRALHLLTEALAMARASGHPRLELEVALLRYVLAAEDPTLDTLAARVSALEGRSASAEPKAAPTPKATAAPKTAAAPKTGGPVTIQKVRAAWQSIRTKVESERATLRVQLSRAMPEAVEGHALIVRLADAWMVDTLREHTLLIESAVADVLGSPLRVTFKVDARGKGGGSPERPAPGESEEPPAARPEEDPDLLFQYANERIQS